MKMICSWPKLVGDHKEELALMLIACVKSFGKSRVENYAMLASGYQDHLCSKQQVITAYQILQVLAKNVIVS
jgi:hypothetical protein